MPPLTGKFADKPTRSVKSRTGHLADSNLLKSQKDYANLYTKAKPNPKPYQLLKVLKWCNLPKITFRVIMYSDYVLQILNHTFRWVD